MNYIIIVIIIFELPASKHLPEEQIFWGTDDWVPLHLLLNSIASSQDNVWEITPLLHHFVTRYCVQYLYLRASTKLLYIHHLRRTHSIMISIKISDPFQI